MENGTSLASAKVPGAHTRMVFAQVIEGLEMTSGQVEDVDVIADCCAVMGGVVCKLLQLVATWQLRNGIVYPPKGASKLNSDIGGTNHPHIQGASLSFLWLPVPRVVASYRALPGDPLP